MLQQLHQTNRLDASVEGVVRDISPVQRECLSQKSTDPRMEIGGLRYPPTPNRP